ncbi:MAG: DUF1622 domain-containing protein [Thermoleophilia bacterium]|nr:DUF1622 domain-containing protein [Thermoleophilia bacterium]
MDTALTSAQDAVREAVDWIVLITEAIGAVVIAIGVAVAVVMLVRAISHGVASHRFVRTRLALGSFLVLGLEFQLAADIMKTAVAPSFTEIGQLAAIAGIRTMLNYFLTKEIAGERAELEARGEEMAPLPSFRH